MRKHNASIHQAFNELVKQADESLLKDLNKLLNRVERLMVPTYFYSHCQVAERLGELRQRLADKSFFATTTEFSEENIVKTAGKSTEYFIRQVDWDRLEAELRTIIGNHPDDSFYLKEVNGEIVHQRRSHEERYATAIAQEKIRQMQVRNHQPVMTGKWRRDPFPARTRVQLTDYVPTDSISAEEGAALMGQLNTPLNGYLGQAYNYDDRGLTEEWMTSFRNGTTAASEDEVARTQLVSLMEIMLSKVQDRIYNEEKILQKPPIVLSKDVVEQPVWGVDSYTRRMVEICLEDGVPQNQRSTLTIKDFIEHRLLPAINRQSPDKAHNLSVALQSILDADGVSARDRLYASTLLSAFHQYGFELFKIHPKGTGVVCINPDGIPPQVLIAEYLGELYPAYRWCERLDVIEQAQKQLEMKPTLPDFYNILLERPRQDPDGYGLLYVDASQKANIGSSCSHSCDANCTSSIVARNGRLTIAMTTNRHVRYGEELTFDYYSITTSDVEWRAAVCLCGMTSCRGSFLAYATQEDLQQVLNQNFGPVSRYASLLRACADKKPTTEDALTLSRHGIKQAILGATPPNWMTKYAADVLRFVEFERKALPCALLRPRNGVSTEYTFSGADMDARCVMEQRIQSMVCCLSMIHRVLLGQTTRDEATGGDRKPLRPIAPRQALTLLWARLSKVPRLLEAHLLRVSDKTPEGKLLRTKRGDVEALLAAVDAVVGEEPASMAAVREAFVKVRRVLAQYQHLSYSKARLLQLADVLALWAATVNFSVPQEYDAVEAAPIAVPARELGSTVPRSVLEKARSKERERELQQRRKERRQLVELEMQLYDVGATPGRKRSKKTSPQSIAANPSAMDLAATAAADGDDARRTASGSPLFGADEVNTTRESAGAELDADHDDGDGDGASTEAAAESAAVTCASTESGASVEAVAVAAAESAMDVDDAPQTASVEAAQTATDGDAVETQPPTVASSASAMDDDDSAAAAAAEPATSVDGRSMDADGVGGDPDATSTAATCSSPSATVQSGGVADSQSRRPTSFHLDPNEPVFTGRKVYDRWFCFWQLMGWFNAGSDQKAEHPDLFGCVELPDPSTCFGASAAAYTAKHQEQLVGLLKDDKLQAMHWPAALKATFNVEQQEALGSTGERVFGSPMLDVVLGQIDSVPKALREIVATALSTGATATEKGGRGGKKTAAGATATGTATGGSGKKATKKAAADDDDARQLDDILAPEAPTNWVQCDACNKWRRVPWHVDLEALPDPWVCGQNTWDIDAATCAAPQDAYDASKENAMYSDRDAQNTFALADFSVGSWWDVYCTKNLVYYEAQVVRLRAPTGKKKGQATQLLFHYKGWSPKFDEWVAFDSERISRHNLFTNPMASDPREQERWQGMQPVTATLRSAYVQTGSKKRKSGEGADEKKDAAAAAAGRARAPESPSKKAKVGAEARD